MFQAFLIVVVFIIIIFPTGKYIYHITTEQHTFADPVFNRLDKAIFRVCRIDTQGMNWKHYTIALLATNAVMMLTGYMVLRLQAVPILNPSHIGAMESALAFNTIISFMTNTNLQHYAGESGLSYLSQMLVIIIMMFTSAATGLSAAMAFMRGLSGKTPTMGNFYVDLVRNITRILLPLSILVSIILIAQGVPQNFLATAQFTTIEGKSQEVAMGPIAAMESIKHLGTNGGGFLGANSATPLENPTVITNMLEMLSMMLLPGACVIAFGYMMADGKKEKKTFLGSQARPIFAVMLVIFIIGVVICLKAETTGTPLFANIGKHSNMEGKEVRFGIAQSALFTTVTTCFTTGSVNNMHDTLTPLGSTVPLVNMMLNMVFGGDGVGLMNMVLYVILAVFICALMIGRSPEYLEKKIEEREMLLASIGIIIHPLLILSFTALAATLPEGRAGISNSGYHGLSQILYEFSSSAANNGSGFEGLADNTNFWNISTGLVMFFGRYPSIIIQLAIAGSLMSKKTVNESFGTLKTNTLTFTVSLLVVIIIISALTFFPVILLGPIAEHMTLWN